MRAGGVWADGAGGAGSRKAHRPRRGKEGLDGVVPAGDGGQHRAGKVLYLLVLRGKLIQSARFVLQLLFAARQPLWRAPPAGETPLADEPVAVRLSQRAAADGGGVQRPPAVPRRVLAVRVLRDATNVSPCCPLRAPRYITSVHKRRWEWVGFLPAEALRYQQEVGSGRFDWLKNRKNTLEPQVKKLKTTQTVSAKTINK